MTVRDQIDTLFGRGLGALRYFGIAGLAFVAITAACGKVDTTSSTTDSSTDSGTSASTDSSTNSNDEFPYGVSSIKWDNRGLNMDVGSWDVNAEITSASHSGEKLTINNNCSDIWEHVQKEGWDKPAIGNYWIIGKVNGEWHAATVDWAGVDRNGMSDLHLDGNAGMYSDLTDWRPVNGEEAYVMMSTFARAHVDTGNQHRTQIVKITINH